MRREKQTGFAILEDNNIKTFGGSNLTSNPKMKRPISLKRSSHLVMRSLFAKGAQSFLKFDREIQNIINRQSKQHGVRVYRLANAGNHIHMVIRPRSRRAYQAFIRSTTGLIARLVIGAQRGSAKNLKFWENRPFTRIVEWGQDYREIMAYLMRNKFEALGFIPYRIRNKHERVEALKKSVLRPFSTA